MDTHFTELLKSVILVLSKDLSVDQAPQRPIPPVVERGPPSTSANRPFSAPSAASAVKYRVVVLEGERWELQTSSASLLRSAVARARARREVVGQRHFDWDTPPPRGGSAQPVGRS